MSCRSAIACLLAVLATTACDRTPAAPQASQDNAADASTPAPDEATAPAAPGGAAKLDRSHKGEAPPAVAFAAPDGKTVTLAAFKGKPVLVNLWATWCAPCVVELPTLDRAAKSLAGKVTVLAISQDSDAAKVAPFLAAKKLTALQPYVDAKMGLSLGYQANLPTTIMLGSDGREVWRRSGDFDWTSAEAQALIAEAR
ncbi:MAG: TlpA family protein disulfide reductase [Sphingomonas sp.]|nr:MAG: TlpA family protein disulfide reductase [Sphingomonas sp.]